MARSCTSFQRFWRSGTDEIIPDAAASSGLWMRLRSEFLAKQVPRVPRAFPLFLQGSSRCACNPCCSPCRLVLCQSVPYVLTRQWFFDVVCITFWHILRALWRQCYSCFSLSHLSLILAQFCCCIWDFAPARRCKELPCANRNSLMGLLCSKHTADTC